MVVSVDIRGVGLEIANNALLLVVVVAAGTLFTGVVEIFAR